MLRDIQKGICLANGSKIKVLPVIPGRAAITRLTMHYLAFRRLFDLKQTFETSLVRKREALAGLNIIVTGDSESASRKKGAEMVKMVEDLAHMRSRGS